MTIIIFVKGLLLSARLRIHSFITFLMSWKAGLVLWTILSLKHVFVSQYELILRLLMNESSLPHNIRKPLIAFLSILHWMVKINAV